MNCDPPFGLHQGGGEGTPPGLTLIRYRTDGSQGAFYLEPHLSCTTDIKVLS